MKRIPLLLALLVPAACVSTQKFKDQEAAAAAEKARADGLDAELAKTKKALADLQAAQAAATEASNKTISDLNGRIKAGADTLASLNVQLDSVKKSNKDLQSSLEANKGELSKKFSELIKEKDGLSNQLKSATDQAADLKRQLAATEQAKADEVAKVKANYEQLTAGLQSEISAGQVTITQLKGKLTLNMVDKILFDSGKAEIKDDGKKVLDKVGGALNGFADKDIRIEGHTDNKPIVGDLREKYPSNWELSTARATSVARYLQDNAHVDPKRLVAAGYGEFRPVSPNDTPENRALNRRIEIILVPRD